MPDRRRRLASRSKSLFRFDEPYCLRHGLIAGVDEVGRGPLAGPVVSAAVILPSGIFIADLNDSKLLKEADRRRVYRSIQRVAIAIGVGIVEHTEIDRINIYQASVASMRLALAHLIIHPAYILVDGLRLPGLTFPHDGVVGGDGRSASIAAASIVAKVVRDAVMETMERHYPGYGFKVHKGYGTPGHLRCLQLLGPSPIHRRSFAPVRQKLCEDAT